MSRIQPISASNQKIGAQVAFAVGLNLRVAIVNLAQRHYMGRPRFACARHPAQKWAVGVKKWASSRIPNWGGSITVARFV